MCGRFTLRTPTGVLVEQFRLESAPDLSPRYNIAPTQDVAVVRNQRGDSAGEPTRELVMLHWGLVPSWSKDPKQGARMINARGETVAEKPAFRAAFRRRRCLVPADGYYEWKKTGGKQKQPYLIHREDDEPFAFAGLWERWSKDENEPPLESCTIITSASAGVTSDLHDRMPVILDEADYDLWLDVEFEDYDRLKELLEPHQVEAIVAEPVSTHVNNVRNEDPQCVEPIV